MKFLFADESFSFETLRTACFAGYDGADLGEVLVTARGITEGDETSWHREWKATAARVETAGRRALTHGHRVSAREALLRASNYHRVSEFYLRDDPFDDADAKTATQRARAAFADAAALLDTPVEAIAIPYDDTALPGYLFLVDDTEIPRPTVIFTSGFDSVVEEAYFAVAAAALRRGYNCLAYDGPGQGAALREQHLFFRPDWENVLTPVIDYALTRPEIDPDAITSYGYSLGGLLVSRAAAFEHRISAVVADGGLYDYHAHHIDAIPSFLADWIMDGHDDRSEPVLETMMAHNTSLRWALRNGKWTFGTDSFSEYVRRTQAYTLVDVAHRITAPTLIFDPEHDIFAGQPALLHRSLQCPATRIELAESEGAGEHCSYGGRATLHQYMFDWLDRTLAEQGKAVLDPNHSAATPQSRIR